MLQPSSHRRAVRRAVRTSCQAVGLRGFRLLGDRALDLSPRGMLVAADGPVCLGDDLIVSFLPPGPSAPWLDAEATVARIIEGQRPGDPGYCMGLDFTYIEKPARQELLTRLAGFPPPVPQRRVRSARERQSCAPLPPRPGVPSVPSVLVHRVVVLGDEPVFPLLRMRAAAHPRGVFC